MPSKRQFLDRLKRSKLIAAVERFELPVTGRRTRDLFINALASSGQVTLTEIQGYLKCARLKEFSRAFALDDGDRRRT